MFQQFRSALGFGVPPEPATGWHSVSFVDPATIEDGRDSITRESINSVLVDPARLSRSATVPQVLDTKSANRWYWNDFMQISDSYDVKQVSSYDPAPLFSMRLFTVWRGTVFASKHLWIEQAILAAMFWLVCAYLLWHPTNDTNPEIWKFFNEKDQDIRDFCEKMSTMAAFLLGFFTALNVERWWRLRTEGIGSMGSASSQLCMYLSQFVTKDEVALSAIRRYTRASLMMIFMRRRGYGTKLEYLSARGLLTEDEVAELRGWNSNLPESIWTWVVAIILKLYNSGMIRSEHQLVFLLERANLGRGGCALICAQLGTPIPLQYVHFIGLLVKVHNVLVSTLMGTVMAGSMMKLGRPMMQLTILARAFFLPMLYNCILLLNEEIMDPFNGTLFDFPMKKYDENFEVNGESCVNAGNNLPVWMTRWRQEVVGRDVAPARTGYGSTVPGTATPSEAPQASSLLESQKAASFFLRGNDDSPQSKYVAALS